MTGASIGDFLIAGAEDLAQRVHDLTIEDDADRVYWNVERENVRNTVRLLRKCDDAITFALTGQHIRPLWTYDRARIEAEQERAGEYDRDETARALHDDHAWPPDPLDQDFALDPPESEAERYNREQDERCER